MSFSSDMKRIVEKDKLKLSKFSKVVKLKLFSQAIESTRVDTGRLRGNWQTSTGAPKLIEIDRLEKSGSTVIREAAANVTAFGVDYLTNNLPYAKPWEEKDGMVARSIVRIERTLKEAARGV